MLPLFLVVRLMAQERVIDNRSYNQGSSYVVKSWTTANGLAQNTILAFLQASDNRVWLSTIDNVLSFDGYHFNSYKLEHAGSPKPRINSIYESHSKGLWFLSDDGRLFTLKNKTLVQFPIDQKVNVFRDAKSGGQFFGTRDGKIYQLGNPSLKLITSFDHEKIVDLLPAKDGLYVLTDFGFYMCKKDGIKTLLDKPNLICIRCNKAGDIFVAGNDRLYQKAAGADIFALVRLPFPCLISDLFVCKPGRFIVGTDQGVLISENGAFVHLNSGDGLSSNQISSVSESKDGTIWVGTKDHGINLLMPKLISLLQDGKSSGIQAVGPIMELNTKELLISHYCEGVSAVSIKSRRSFFPKDTGCVWTMTEDHSGGVWLGTYNQGLFYQSKKGLTRYFDALEGNNNVYFSSLTDRSNTTWLGSMNGIFFARNGKLERFTNDPSRTPVAQFCEDGEGRVWVCRRSHLGLIENDTYAIMPVPGLAEEDDILYLFPDKDGVIWGITYFGNLIRYKNERFFIFHTAGALIEGKGCNLIEDDNGKLWIGSFAGIYAADKKNLNDFADGKTRFIDLVHIGKESGMQNLECNTGFQPSVCKTSNGLIYFSTIGGTAVLNPALYRVSDPDYSLGFAAFYANGISYPPDSVINLAGHGEKRIECHLSAICFSQKENLRIQYRLDKLDSAWSQPTSDLKIIYDHLSSGSYKIRVRVYGNINEKHLRFNIPLPFWRTSLFLGCAGALLLASALLLVLIRQRKRRKRERLKSDINKQYAELELKSLKAQMNPHFIFNCLNSIKYFIETDSKVANDYLYKFSMLIRSFLEQSNSNDTLVVKEIRLLTLYMEMEQLRSDHGFDFEFRVSKSINPDQIRIPAMLIQPFVENAIHHGIRHLNKRGHIAISFELSNGLITVTIEDNGIGRKRSREINQLALASHESMGSKFTEDRIRVINTVRNTNIQLSYVDKPDHADGTSGLKIILTIPLKPTAP